MQQEGFMEQMSQAFEQMGGAMGADPEAQARLKAMMEGKSDSDKSD